MSFTPGPWTWFDYPDGRKLLSGPNRAVIHCPDAPMACDPEDEHLIAAAPDMLQALREILADAYYVENPGGTPICAHCQELEGDEHNPDCSMQFVIDAIAKAEGR